MRTFALDGFDTRPRLRDDLQPPAVGEGQLLVRVRTSSVNPVDAAIVGGMLRDMVEHRFPIILGRDFAGVVEQTGGRYAPGDEVFGWIPHADPAVHVGTWTDLVVLAADGFVAAKPANVSFEDAGAAGLAGVTALAALDALDLAAGETLLIVGATGGVGSFAVQLAREAGVSVIAPALPEDEGYLRGLGVRELVERGADVAAAVRERHPAGVDALLDVVSYTPGEFDANAGALTEDGRGASVVGAAGEGPGRFNVMGTSDPGNAERLARLLEAGTVKVPIQRTFPLEQAGEALDALASTHTQGKLAITM
jgi:NADPH:quinone reductase-like Zn-dependent oxidoreductase